MQSSIWLNPKFILEEYRYIGRVIILTLKLDLIAFGFIIENVIGRDEVLTKLENGKDKY